MIITVIPHPRRQERSKDKCHFVQRDAVTSTRTYAIEDCVMAADTFLLRPHYDCFVTGNATRNRVCISMPTRAQSG